MLSGTGGAWQSRYCGYMKPSTENTVEGQLHEIAGAIKEKVGQILHKPDVEADGAIEKIGGAIQKKVGDVQKVFGN